MRKHLVYCRAGFAAVFKQLRSFFIISFVSLLGFNITKATAHTKLLLLLSNLAALIAFIAGGQIVWKLGITMAIGQWIGARYGSQLVHLKGTKIVRPMLITICFIMLGKLIVLR